MINKRAGDPAAQQVSCVDNGSRNLIVASAGGSPVVITAQGTVQAWGFGAGAPVFKLSPVAAALVMVEAAFSAAIAIYLLVIGILTIRQSRRGKRLHIIYAILKIPVAVFGVIATAWMWATFVAPGPGASSAVAATMGLLASVGLIYPIILLIVLNVGTARDYYRSPL
jgi:hypothetical protein